MALADASNLSAWWDVDYLGATGSATLISDQGSTANTLTSNFTTYLYMRSIGDIPYALNRRMMIEAVGERLLKDPNPQGVIRELTLVNEYTGAVAAGSAQMEGVLLEAWRAIQAHFNPWEGRKFLKIRRRDAADSANVDSILYARPISFPALEYHRGSGQVPGAWSSTSPVLTYPLRIFSGFPFAWDPTEDEDNTTSIGASAGTATVNNAGTVPCGAYFTVENYSATVSGVHVKNDTNGTEFTVKCASGFTNGDTFDLWHTNKQMEGSAVLTTSNASGFDENPSSEGRGSFRLDPGNNTITCTRDGGAGSMTLEIRNQPCYGHI